MARGADRIADAVECTDGADSDREIVTRHQMSEVLPIAGHEDIGAAGHGGGEDWRILVRNKLAGPGEPTLVPGHLAHQRHQGLVVFDHMGPLVLQIVGRLGVAVGRGDELDLACTRDFPEQQEGLAAECCGEQHVGVEEYFHRPHFFRAA